ncbi:divalent-cation tolerance protein CutA [Acidihalobacter prosperus]
MHGHLLVLTTYPDREGAEQLATKLVQNSLAACVNVLPAMRSFYVWKGQPTAGDEYLLLIKTHENRYEALEKTILAIHPYELPEIIATPITQGLSGYLNWIESSTSP